MRHQRTLQPIVQGLTAVLLMFVAAVAKPAVAAQGDIKWIRQFGTTADDGLYRAFYNSGPRVATHKSSLYLAGVVGVDGALPGQTSGGLRDVFVRRYNFDGSVIWTRQFGSAADDAANAISVDDSGVYVAGDTAGALPGQESSGDWDVFVRKYDVDGNEKWTRQFGTPGGEGPWGIVVHSSGVYVAGWICGAFPDQADAGGYCDGWLRKYDLDGTALWTRQFGTPAIDWVLGIAADSTGVYVAGRTDGDFAHPNAGHFDAFVRKYDVDGEVVWTEQFGTESWEEVFGIAASSLGVYVAGYTSGTLQTSSGDADAFVRKYSADGTELWTRQIGTSGVDLAGAVSVKGCRLYVSGVTNGIFPGQAAAGGFDAFVSSFDLDGNVLWTTQMGTAGTDAARSVAGAPSGAYVSGYTDGALPQQTSAGGADAFVARIRGIVQTPLEGIEGTIAQVRLLVAQGVLNHGQGNALITKLEGAGRQLGRGKIKTAINVLRAFINQVNDLIATSVLLPQQGQPLIDAARAIIAALSAGR